MDTLQKISKYEAIGLITIVILNQIILNLPNTLLLSTGTSSWVNVIYISFLALLFCKLICKLFKPFGSSDLLDISKFLGGNFFKIIIGILYISFFIFFSGILLRYMSNSLKIIYFTDIPLAYVLLFFIIPATIVCRYGIKVISRTNLIFIPIFIFSILVLIFSTIASYDPQRIFPILGQGFNETFLIGIFNIFSFTCFAYLYFLIPLMQNPNEFKKVAISSIIISAIYLLSSIICLLMLFPFITFTEEMLSIYLIARLIEFGRFFQRIDALFIFIWIYSLTSLLSISLFFICNIFKKLTNIKDYTYMCYPFSIFIFSLALYIENIAQIKYIQNVIFKYLILILVFIISPLILILAYLKQRKFKYEN